MNALAMIAQCSRHQSGENNKGPAVVTYLGEERIDYRPEYLEPSDHGRDDVIRFDPEPLGGDA